MPLTTPLPSGTLDFPDGLLNRGRNGSVAVGAVQAAIARRIQYLQHQGRPIFHWWGGWTSDGILYATTGATVFRFARHNYLEGGGRHLRMNTHVLPPLNPGDSATNGVNLNGYNNPSGWNGTDAYYADNILQRDNLTDNNDDDVTSTIAESTIGFDNVRPVAGAVFEDQIKGMNASETVTDGSFASGRDVLATQAGSYTTLAQLASRANHVHQNRTTQISWSCEDSTYLEFSTSSQAYRYVNDQTIGTGGTAPSATGPAITLPNKYAGFGVSTMVRVYVYVYAAMSGATDGGTLAVANKDALGAMGAMTALHNPQMVGGTGFAWYPSLGSFDASTAPYFLSPTGVAFDRVCLGGRSEGATDKLQIKAWTMVVYPVVD